MIYRIRLVQLLEKLTEDRDAKIIIFTGTKKMADECTRILRQDGFPALSIHGDKKQQERDWVMQEFKTGKQPILIATDVAARGLGKEALQYRRIWQFGFSWLFPSRAITLPDVPRTFIFCFQLLSFSVLTDHILHHLLEKAPFMSLLR
jgi:hypothetical protein